MPRGSDKEILLAGFEMARVWSGLLVSLSAASIVFTATFVKNFIPEDKTVQDLQGLILLEAAWVVLGISIIAGVLLLGNLAGLLNKGNVSDLDVYGPVTRFFAVSQILTFITGGSLLLVFFLKVVSQ